MKVERFGFVQTRPSYDQRLSVLFVHLLKSNFRIASFLLDQLRTPLLKMISFVQAKFGDETINVK
jgi:hypothetical protein